jgi:exopolyphosphatase/guanosine-5'-triphosphate,3'-diphosphate pyrophosphatase
MRLGVLDVGSNTVHLLVVDAHRGAHPWPTYSEKSVLRLAERIGRDGKLSNEAADELVTAVGSAKGAVAQHGATELLGFATSAMRDAMNSNKVLARVRQQTGVDLHVLTGADEARLTFLAVRRWFGWSAGRLLAVDIGGGSLEIAAGYDEQPELALSLPLGAGRLTRERFSSDPPPASEVAALVSYVDSALADVPSMECDRAAATSKTFRTLARLAGAAPSTAGFRTPRSLSVTGLHQVIGFISRIPSNALGEMDGVNSARARQLLAGAIVAEATMRRLGLDQVDICPWALREGVILERLDSLPAEAHDGQHRLSIETAGATLAK